MHPSAHLASVCAVQVTRLQCDLAAAAQNLQAAQQEGRAAAEEAQRLREQAEELAGQSRALSEMQQQAQKYNAQLQEYNGRMQGELQVHMLQCWEIVPAAAAAAVGGCGDFGGGMRR